MWNMEYYQSGTAMQKSWYEVSRLFTGEISKVVKLQLLLWKFKVKDKFYPPTHTHRYIHTQDIDKGQINTMTINLSSNSSKLPDSKTRQQVWTGNILGKPGPLVIL